LWGPSGSFSQANDGINQRLVEQVLALAEPTGMRVLELHCGMGNFTVALAKDAETLIAVEQHAGPAQACRANLAARGLKARVVETDASRAPKGRYDVIVLDPPRQGARALFEDSGFWHDTRRIVYVSCDTATLARDLHLACQRGYRIDRMIAFDMFPQTAHLESVVRLVPR
jgi:23S rRNA (uracil1939-C5)-methyltransferase